MVKIKPNWGVWWPEDASNLDATEVIQMYKAGYVGAYQDPEAKERVSDHMRAMGDSPNGSDVAHRYGFAESGAGKLTLLFPSVTKYYGYEALSKPAQNTGDCQHGSAMVRMADGSKRQLDGVKVGEYVVSANGKFRKVTRTIEKPYSGDMVRVSLHGQLDGLEATPDHLVLAIKRGNETLQWTPIGDLSVGDKVLSPSPVDESDCTEHIFDMADFCPTGAVLPDEQWGRDIVRNDGSVYCRRLNAPPAGKVRAKGSRRSVNRHVSLNENLAWLVGLYAAKGSLDTNHGSPRRITLNIGSHRFASAVKAKAVINETFGEVATISCVPSKPTVVYVRSTCIPVAALIAHLCPGNVYSKTISRLVMKSPRSVRLACLRGWLDGDGHVGRGGAMVGASSSRDLIMFMRDIAVSCGLDPVCSRRPPRGATKESYRLNLSACDASAIYGDEAAPVTEGMSEQRIKKPVKRCGKNTLLDNGIAALVTNVDRVRHDGNVYCLEVEQDASFISDGYAVHNCVSMGGRDVSLMAMCIDADAGLADEVTGRVEEVPQVSDLARNNGVLANEGIYLHRGHSGQGMSCDQGLEWVMKVGGLVVRKKYPQVDLEKYNVNFELNGSRGSPDWLDAEGKQHQIRRATYPETWEQARDFMAIGCPIWTCSGLGFSDVRDENGYSRRSGSWSHSWHLAGFDDRPWTRQVYGFPLALFGHRWGSWNSGPRRIRDTNIDIPNGYAWIDARLLNQCWMAAVSSVNGWPKRNLPDYGFSVLG